MGQNLDDQSAMFQITPRPPACKVLKQNNELLLNFSHNKNWTYSTLIEWFQNKFYV